MSSLFDLFAPRNPTRADLDSYDERLLRGIRVLAIACGNDDAREVRRFNEIRHALGSTFTAKYDETNVERLPTPVELVLTLAPNATAVAFERPGALRGSPRGFAYLTQGGGGPSFPTALIALLRSTLAFHIKNGGTPQDAELIADIFQTAFPRLEKLDDFSPLAQGMLVGIAPRLDIIDLKLYFNTRLDNAVDHRTKVLKILTLCGLTDTERNGKLYDALYASALDTRFTGVGVDVGDRDSRAKLYVHVPRKTAADFVQRIVDMQLANASVEHVRALLESTHSKASTTDCEIAFAVRENKPATVKLTTFFSGRDVRDADGKRVLGLLERLQYPVEPVRDLFDVLMVEKGSTQRYPLHGVGLELEGFGNPKINVYAKPAL